MVTWSVLLSGQVVNLDSAPFRKSILSIGRKNDSDLSIPSEAVSRKHAEIQRVKSDTKGVFDYYLKDLESINGTWIKKEKYDIKGVRETSWQELQPFTAYKLGSGVTMRFGDMEVAFTFQEKLEANGQMYLSDILKEQLNDYKEEDDDDEYQNSPEAVGNEKTKETAGEGKQFLHTILDVISQHNPFQKKGD